MKEEYHYGLSALEAFDCQKENELQAYADQVVDEVFDPLWENDEFLLDYFEDNEHFWYSMLSFMAEKWRVPSEDEVVVFEAERYAPQGEA